MQNTNNDIDQLNKNYPQPDISVEEAWSKMQIQLNAELPVKSGGVSSVVQKLAKSTLGKISIGVIVVTSIIGIWLYSSKDNPAGVNQINVLQEEGVQNVGGIKTVDGNDSSQNDPTENAPSEQRNKKTISAEDLVDSDRSNVKSRPQSNKQIQKNQEVFNPGLSENEQSQKNNAIHKGVRKGGAIPEIDVRQMTLTNKVKNRKYEDRKDGKSVSSTTMDELLTQKNNKEYKEALARINSSSTNHVVKHNSDWDKKKEDDFCPLIPSLSLKPTKYVSMEIKEKSFIKSTLKIDSVNKKGSGLSFLHFVDAGLQWNIPMVTNANGQYFTGSNGEQQVYKTFVPSIWISKRWNKNEVFLTFVPFQQNFINNKPLSDYTDQSDLSDSLTIINHKTFLFKTMGFGVGVQYNYQITPMFAVGAGLNYNQQGTAVIRQTDTRLMRNLLLRDSVYTVKSSDFIKPNFIAAKLELMYCKRRFDAGLNLQLPLTDQSANPDFSIKSINGQVFFRWRLWTK
ncbi:hypothetical protein [Solitalea canadensis]|uniref:Uncharacterized protein n=1 Tax=Solitalea canadensis (strain ATCC 29591 / DSM 3403 / JCM 21819 / LMG 8368 / NBRC 15130 / NCIMB 12057 / USAM 9D) TaxID=929556 RepID=H8KMN3_SOLCM|nr:hypothetical protein [Solitalea canadensis]AFD09024.1 hypothetical protein Solca_4034 [Solitalea canadensis DSM 3403]